MAPQLVRGGSRDLGCRQGSVALQPFLVGFQLVAQASADRLASNSKPLAGPRGGAVVGEAKKVEGLGLSLSLDFCTLLRLWPKRQALGLFLGEFESEASEAPFHFDAVAFGIRFVLETGHVIIRIADESGRLRAARSRSPLKPEAQRVVEVEVASSGEMTPPCGVPLSLACQLPSSWIPALRKRLM